MADSILVIVEQREGKLNRVSWETLTAGQALAAGTGWTLEAAVAGSGVTSFANEIAAKKVATPSAKRTVVKKVAGKKAAAVKTVAAKVDAPAVPNAPAEVSA